LNKQKASDHFKGLGRPLRRQKNVVKVLSVSCISPKMISEIQSLTWKPYLLIVGLMLRVGCRSFRILPFDFFLKMIVLISNGRNRTQTSPVSCQLV